LQHSAGSEYQQILVLPVRIELTTSPFITLTLSRPPVRAFVRWTIPSPSVASTFRRHPSGLYTFPTLRAWLGIAVG
jgi:hypothetical protein